MAGQLEADLLEVARRGRALAGPRNDGHNEALVRLAVERELRLDQPVGVVQDRVRAGVHSETRGCRSPNLILNWFMARAQPRVPVPRALAL
ncbi:hypothetical protein [Streptomyces sp. NPDC001415]